jgi:hypothetical protein
MIQDLFGQLSRLLLGRDFLEHGILQQLLLD